jgi:hypothetical protein
MRICGSFPGRSRTFISSLNLPYKLYWRTVSYIFYTWSYFTVDKAVGTWGCPNFEIKNAWNSVHTVPTHHITFAETNLLFTFKIISKILLPSCDRCIVRTTFRELTLLPSSETWNIKPTLLCPLNLLQKLVQSNLLTGTQLYPSYTLCCNLTDYYIDYGPWGSVVVKALRY